MSKNNHNWVMDSLYKEHPYKIGLGIVGAYVAYVGIDKNCITIEDLKRISEELECHGGVTYLSIDREDRDLRFSESEWQNFYWIGWDYAHLGDYISGHSIVECMSIDGSIHKWTVDEIKNEVIDVINDLIPIINLIKTQNENTDKKIEKSGKDYDTSQFVSTLLSRINSDDWKENLQAEYHFLWIRERKLTEFLNKCKKNGIKGIMDTEDYNMLNAQLNIMRAYKYILEAIARKHSLDLFMEI